MPRAISTVQVPEDTTAMLEKMKREGRVRLLDEAPKTLVLCQDEAKTVCFLTGVGMRTLRQRIAEEERFFAPAALRKTLERNEVLE